MMRTLAVVALLGDLDRAELAAWIERGWVCPDVAGTDDWEFQEIDVARVRLIRDLRRTMELTEDAVELALSLLDQVYDLRATLRDLSQAIEEQSPEVRAAIAAALPTRQA
jgi:chaperone modulatory protein CbpM